VRHAVISSRFFWWEVGGGGEEGFSSQPMLLRPLIFRDSLWEVMS